MMAAKSLKIKLISGLKFGRKLGILLQVLFLIIRKKPKKQYKQSVHRIKRRNIFLIREKLSNPLERRMDGFWLAVKKLVQQSKSQATAVDGITDPSDITNLFANNLLLNFNSPESRKAMHGSIKSSL